MKDKKRLQDAVSIWAHRHRCRVKTKSYRFPHGYQIHVEVVSNYR